MVLSIGELGGAYAHAWEVWDAEERDAWEAALADGLTPVGSAEDVGQ